MAAVLDGLARVVAFLGGTGPVLLSIVLLVAAPFVDRLLVRRKRVVYRILYNSKIGIGPETLGDGADPVPPQLRQVARLLDRMSMVVVRIRNGGSYDIEPDDFEHPLTFVFGERLVWNARISEASTPELRKELRAGMRFFRTEDNGQPARDNLSTVRQWLKERVTGLVVPQPGQQQVAEPGWHGVRLDGLSLKRGQKAKLVVVLREPDLTEGEITKTVRITGKMRDTGLIKDEGRARAITLPRVSGMLAGLLTIVLVLGLVSRPADGTVACASGELRIEGSSAFMPAIEAVVAEYHAACGDDARITTEATGSVKGVRNLINADPAAASGLIVVSDGRGDDKGLLRSDKIAIVVYHVVVNGRVGLTSLRRADLQKIYDGTYTDWKQVPGAGTAALPIRIVGRGESSGTRLLFEHEVLGPGTGEGLLSSGSCLTKDRYPAAPVIRCEREDNAEIVRIISTVDGAIGYADELSLNEARGTGDVTALTLDGQAFAPSTAGKPGEGYPFWTAEYLYYKGAPAPGSLKASFLSFVRAHVRAQARISAAGFEPCAASPVTRRLCDLR
ncbi:hypothetical protein Sme01_17150 [Sphaerisporangium melleum]|uniref:PBP domain-containing protein n=1 Tax=Sphaerisporangium melleum TaxID=321316 RepID=A0A917R1M5_9ACTN|nr:substrate-binding domain-containing protein [Sphaerisporangium melleum]GGK83103.1 hypothetical protein GCM10007964_27090 [Sphaerisporangium melleum]GII69239.1 hypothetical protein Sme01_17150 [Sphaerisporangium melleum]